MAAGKRIRIIAVLFVVSVAVIIAAYYGLRRRDEPAGYIETTGEAEALEVEITSRIAGRISWLCCGQGEAVKVGAPLVRLDDAELSARLAVSKAAVAFARENSVEVTAALENAKAAADASGQEAGAAGAEIKRVAALLGDARANLERAKGLFAGGFVTRKDLDSANAQYDALNAGLLSAQAHRAAAEANQRNSAASIKVAASRISTAQARIAEAEAAERVADAVFADTVINSPIDGVVVYKSFETGETVSAGASIYTIDDLDNVWARIDIEETAINMIKLGARAQVFLDGQPDRPYEAKIIEIGELGGFATQRDVTRGRHDIKTFRVKAGIEKNDGGLKSGMTVRVRIGVAGAR